MLLVSEVKNPTTQAFVEHSARQFYGKVANVTGITAFSFLNYSWVALGCHFFNLSGVRTTAAQPLPYEVKITWF